VEDFEVFIIALFVSVAGLNVVARWLSVPYPIPLVLGGLALYRFRQRRFKTQAGFLEDEEGIEDRSLAYQRLMHELYEVQRRALVRLRNEGAISSEVMRRIEHELDLEESRLEV
jgi:hypothetical protein